MDSPKAPFRWAETALLLAVAIIAVSLAVHSIHKVYLAATATTTPAIAIGATPAEPSLPNEELCPDEPTQKELAHPKTFRFKGYNVKELASFDTKAYVLSTLAYPAAKNEHKGALAPYDYAIGWGMMSNPAILSKFHYYQRNRFFYFANLTSFTEEANRLHTEWHVANVHLIPATNAVAEALSNVHPNDVVRLTGSLVAVYYGPQLIWKSSLSRTDSGDGACELLYLTRIEWYTAPLGRTTNLPHPIPPEEETLPQAK